MFLQLYIKKINEYLHITKHVRKNSQKLIPDTAINENCLRKSFLKSCTILTTFYILFLENSKLQNAKIYASPILTRLIVLTKMSERSSKLILSLSTLLLSFSSTLDEGSLYRTMTGLQLAPNDATIITKIKSSHVFVFFRILH